MAVILVQEVFSHASCKKALALAAEALVQKLATGKDLDRPDALTQQELDLLNKVQQAFCQGGSTKQQQGQKP